MSDEVSRVAVYDAEVPVVAVAVTPGSNAKTEDDHTLAGSVTDNLSVRYYSISVGFGGTFYELGGMMVDAYNSDPLTKSVPINESIKLPFLAVQDASDIGDQIGAGNIRIFARDHGGNDKEGLDALSGDFTGGTSFSSAMGFELTADNQSDDNTLSFTANVTSTDNPFDRVIFYAAAHGNDMDRRLIATVEEYDARRSSGKWSYRARVSADDFYAAVDGDGDYTGNVYAVGVRESGTQTTEDGSREHHHHDHHRRR